MIEAIQMVEPSEANRPQELRSVAAQTWIYGPWIDLVVGCGAWSAPLLLVTAYVSGAQASHWSFAFYFLDCCSIIRISWPRFIARITPIANLQNTKSLPSTLPFCWL